MARSPLKFYDRPTLVEPRMVLGLSGWMDGGEVSTGAIEWLVEHLDAALIAEIDHEPFYLANFPGSMEIASLFRPHVVIEDGLIRSLEVPANEFFCAPAHNLVLFEGREPNVRWRQFVDCVFDVADAAGVSTIYFIGSVGGATPHTREPRLLSTVSSESLKPTLAPLGVAFTDYEGPASVVTYMMTRAPKRGLKMASIVAEVPAYVQGRNPKSIEAVLRKLGPLLGVPLQLDALRAEGDEWERKLNEHVANEPKLAKHIRKLEEAYDHDVFDSQMGDLKDWLEGQGLRVD